MLKIAQKTSYIAFKVIKKLSDCKKTSLNENVRSLFARQMGDPEPLPNSDSVDATFTEASMFTQD